mmetsp:Transcript_36748/g.118159  ORF Transcript_36748/g.118159 Transcript_36748/m.118159 type:complete len:223 (-) Transcript_36748:1209-1877(-)
MAFSASASSRQGTRKKPAPGVPGPSASSSAAFISAYEFTCVVPRRSLSSAAASSAACIAASSAATAAPRPSPAPSSNLSPPVRRAATNLPCATSRGPTSRRSGMPLRSHSKNFGPGRRLKRWSTCTRTPADSICRTACATKPMSTACSSGALSGPCEIGMTTAWMGATFGGSTSPASSEWLMMRAPTSRVDTPHEVAHTSCWALDSSWKDTSKARAKFCPRK